MIEDVAILVGGAERVWSDAELAENMCICASKTVRIFVANDMISRWPGANATGVTLHPNDLAGWLAARRSSGHPPLREVWAHREHRGMVHRWTRDWGGSVGLFMAKIALVDLEHPKAILCGVPMVASEKHFVRDQPWPACTTFQKYWEGHWQELKNARSFSGWTAEKLGMPNSEWLAG